MEYDLPLQHFARQVAGTPQAPWLHQPIDRQWHTFTWGEADNQARRIAAGLKAQGYAPGSRIAILSKNCAEWVIADLAIMMAGMISVPIYSTAGKSTIEYVLDHSASNAIFVGKLDKPEAADQAIPTGVERIAFPYQTVPATALWQQWLDSHQPLQDIADPKPGDVMTIPYTSGSTGVPKGVVLTFLNLAASAECSARQIDGLPGDRALSYLPMAHITERALVELVSMVLGSEVFFNESLDTFADDLRYTRPSTFISVPRLWSRFQSQILSQISDKKLQRLLRIPILGKRVAVKIRRSMGLDRARSFGSGTAPISPEMLRWFHRLGISIGEGWGMTETAGLSCGNFPFRAQDLGSIGRPVDCVEMKLTKDGEILIRGDAVFSEYYLNPEATAESFTDDWFHTGDLGTQLNGVFRIVGRIKEQFKTAKGKYVAPVPIEIMLMADPGIEQACVMGSGRKQPVAFVVMSEAANDSTPVRDGLDRLVREVNATLESHQRLDHLIVCEDAWDTENGMLTPTLKLKRSQIETRYADLVDSPKLANVVVWERELG